MTIESKGKYFLKLEEKPVDIVYFISRYLKIVSPPPNECGRRNSKNGPQRLPSLTFKNCESGNIS